jgi:Mn-containing catalase
VKTLGVEERSKRKRRQETGRTKSDGERQSEISEKKRTKKKLSESVNKEQRKKHRESRWRQKTKKQKTKRTKKSRQGGTGCVLEEKKGRKRTELQDFPSLFAAKITKTK